MRGVRRALHHLRAGPVARPDRGQEDRRARAVRPRQARPLDRHRLPQARHSRRSKIDRLVSSIQRQLETRGDEVKAAEIGEAVMDGLKALDHVAYIRFASVYKDFSEPGHFAEIAGTSEEEAAATGPRQTAGASCSKPPSHHPRPPAARAEYRQVGAGDAQFRAHRDAAGERRATAGPTPTPGRRRAAPTWCSSGRGCSIRSKRRSPIARSSTPRRCAAATSSCRCIDPAQMADADRRLERALARSCSGPSARASRPRKWRSPMRSSPFRSIPNSPRSTSPRR